MLVACGCEHVVTIDETGGGSTTSTSTATSMSSGGAGGIEPTGGNAGAGGTGGIGPGGSGGTTAAGCQSNADCVGAPLGPICNVETGDCVSCLVVADPALDCGIGSWCDGAEGQCKIGCTGEVDCAFSPTPLVCDLDAHTCKGCLSDGDCPAGAICDPSGDCVPGCNLVQPCQAGFSCCGEQCFDLASDEENCGGCDQPCSVGPNAIPLCSDGQCTIGGCVQSFADCNGIPSDGCEHPELVDGPCQCEPGAIQSCYLGMPGTEGVGKCKAGTQTCKADGWLWGPCTGQVLPSYELCGDGVDDDCDGLVDEPTDKDGDGWGICDGDCNDNNFDVNPGAMELTYVLIDDDNDPGTPAIKVYSGNGLDDDCNPATSDTVEPPACVSVAKLTGVTAQDLAAAMELCHPAVANPPLAQRTWGLLSAQLLRADGSAPEAAQLSDMMDKQAAVLSGYGMNAPKVGATFVGLSTGMMRDEDDPGAVPPSPGTDLGWTGSPPAGYLMWNGSGGLPGSAGCSGACPGGAGANDGVTLRLVLRVPTNMGAFSLDYQVFTAAYPGGVCSGENDFFLALLTSMNGAIPLDKNIGWDLLGNPLSVNNAFFGACAPAGCFTCPKGTAGLAGTGMSAGTGWLQADAPVIPGEEMILDLTVFDVSTGSGDWVALVDGFRMFKPSAVWRWGW